MLRGTECFRYLKLPALLKPPDTQCITFYVLLLSCSIIPREAWRTSGKTKSVGFKKSLNIDVETYMKGIAYFTVGNLQDFTNSGRTRFFLLGHEFESPFSQLPMNQS